MTWSSSNIATRCLYKGVHLTKGQPDPKIWQKCQPDLKPQLLGFHLTKCKKDIWKFEHTLRFMLCFIEVFSTKDQHSVNWNFYRFEKDKKKSIKGNRMVHGCLHVFSTHYPGAKLFSFSGLQQSLKQSRKLNRIKEDRKVVYLHRILPQTDRISVVDVRKSNKIIPFHFQFSSPVLATSFAEEQLNGKKKSPSEDDREFKCQVCVLF